MKGLNNVMFNTISVNNGNLEMQQLVEKAEQLSMSQHTVKSLSKDVQGGCYYIRM